MQNLLYFTSARLPNKKAHSVQILKMCDTFSNYYNTFLFCKKDYTNDIKKKFNLKNTFKIKNINIINFPIISIFSKLICVIKSKISQNSLIFR